MAKVKVSAEYNLVAISVNAGADSDLSRYIDGYLVCPDVTQEALDSSLESYDHEAAMAPTTAQKIAALESSVTMRWLRGAALGDEYAIDKIRDIEDKIQDLRE